MTETHQPLFRLAERYISPKRANITEMMKELKAKPEIFDGLVKEADGVIVSLNSINPNELSEHDRSLLPNTINLKSILLTGLPLISDLENDPRFPTVKAGIETFRLADILMEQGETPGSSQPKWEFHQQIDDPEQLAASLMLEMYGKFSEQSFPEIARMGKGGFNVVLALEEVIATHNYQCPKLFDTVRQWYSVDEGFSPELVKHVESLS